MLPKRKKKIKSLTNKWRLYRKLLATLKQPKPEELNMHKYFRRSFQASVDTEHFRDTLWHQ